MDRRFLGILGGVIIIFIAIFAISSHSSNSPSNSSSGGGTPTNHKIGSGKSSVTLIEYGDYECPVCSEYFKPLQQVSTQFSDQIYFQFRNLPLSQIHLNAVSSARAAEAAGLQNKFWQMHDQLYANQDPTGATGWVASKDPLNDFYVKYASAIGLDINKFKTDYASDQVNNDINADLNAFLSTPYVNHDTNKEATPSFFLDGKYIDNSQVIDSSGVSVTKFASLINAEIAKKQPAKNGY